MSNDLRSFTEQFVGTPPTYRPVEAPSFRQRVRNMFGWLRRMATTCFWLFVAYIFFAAFLNWTLHVWTPSDRSHDRVRQEHHNVSPAGERAPGNRSRLPNQFNRSNQMEPITRNGQASHVGERGRSDLDVALENFARQYCTPCHRTPTEALEVETVLAGNLDPATWSKQCRRCTTNRTNN